MYEVVIVKADYEGWWLFEGWQEDIIKGIRLKQKKT